MELQKIKEGIEISEIFTIASRPEDYPEEVVFAALDVVKLVSDKLREAKQMIEINCIRMMQRDNASKMVIRGVDGDKVLTMKNGSYKCTEKEAADKWTSAGFDPLEIGEMEYKPSWSKAKEVRKLGGKKQELIDEFFKEGQKSITISEVKK